MDGLSLDTDEPGTIADRFGDVRVGAGLTPALLAESAAAIEATIGDRFPGDDQADFPASGVGIPPSVHPDKLHAVRRGLREST